MADAKLTELDDIGRALDSTDKVYVAANIGSGAFGRRRSDISRFANPPVRFDVNPNTETLTPRDIDQPCISYSINPAADAATFGWDEVGHVWV